MIPCALAWCAETKLDATGRTERPKNRTAQRNFIVPPGMGGTKAPEHMELAICESGSPFHTRYEIRSVSWCIATGVPNENVKKNAQFSYDGMINCCCDMRFRINLNPLLEDWLDQQKVAEVFGGGVNAFSLVDLFSGLRSVSSVPRLRSLVGILDVHPRMITSIGRK
jgi:hypothetical protein